MATTFPLEIDDTSPLIIYTPFGDTLGSPNISAGWNPYYSESGYITNPGMVGEGASSHRTAHDGATLAVTWIGTGIQLYGNATSASYTVTLDSAVQSDVEAHLDQALLFQTEDLADENHLLVLTAHMNSTMSLMEFDRATITASTRYNGSIVETKLVNSTDFILHGSWTLHQDSSLNVSYTISDAFNDTAVLTFNGTAITVDGLRSESAGDYTVALDGNIFHYTATSSASEAAVLFMQSGLASEVEHHLVFTNSGNGSLALASGNITSSVGGTPLMTSSSTSSSTPKSAYTKGAIVAIALAGFFGALFLVMVGYFLWRRERRRAAALRPSIPPDLSGLSKEKLSLNNVPPLRQSSPPRLSSQHGRVGVAGNLAVPILSGGFSQLHPYSSRDAEIEARYQSWYKGEEPVAYPGVQVPELSFNGRVPGSSAAIPVRDRQPSSSSSGAKKHKKGMSFLDFASSASSSLRRSRSRSTRSRVPSSKSHYSHSNSNSSRQGKHQSGGQFSFAISVGDGPFPLADGGEYVTAHVSPRRQSRRRSSSPTDSVPMTVSEIAFRHGSDVDEDRRTSGSHLPPHPPLPGVPPLPDGLGSPRIVQMLLGRGPTPSPLTPAFPANRPPDTGRVANPRAEIDQG